MWFTSRMNERRKVRFTSAGTDCVAWHYPGTNGACVVMAGGFAVTKEPATDRFARRFHDAGYTVLAFDYRRLGESDGEPRLVLPVKDQIADWHAALGFAATLPGVDPARLATWGFSATGGYALEVAARDHRVAAVISQTPNVGGLANLRNASAYQTKPAMLRLTGRAIADVLRGWAGRPPRLVPLVGEAGTVAMLSAPDALDGPRALGADRHPEWQQAVAARSVLGLARYRSGRFASRVRCPLLVLVCDDDRTALPGPAARAAARAARGEIVRMPGGHYEPFLAGHERAVEAQLAFLRQNLLERKESHGRRGLSSLGRIPAGGGPAS
jgi:fermentation-respiration switch protein FrsA (DUF1100 family)